MRKLSAYVILLFVMVFPYAASAQSYDGVVYVTPSGTGDGTSWADAYGDINAAITAAASNGKLPVWIAAGTYYGDGNADNNAFTMARGVNIYGGFAGDEPKTYDLSLRDFETNKTILDGQNVQRVLYSDGSSYETICIDGFTIQNGVQTNSGGGVYMNYTTMTNCVVRDNESSNSGGGGVYMYYSNLLNSSITDNVCQYWGAGVYAYSGSTISGCLIANNVQNYPGISDAYAGGICAYHDVVIKNCIIKNNSSYNTGGVSLEYGATLENCLVANNTGGAITGGVFMWSESWSGDSKLTNCDVVRNDGGGINGSGAIINTIVWGNEKNGSPLDMAGSGITATNSAVGGGCSGTNNVILDVDNTGTGFYHPKFASPSTTAGVEATPGSWSWQLTGGSVCANRGTSEGISVPEKDLAGNDRVQQGIIDMGCYESNFTATTIPTFDEIVYVVPNGAGNKTGTSWANATGDINYAIGQARVNGLHKVWVAAGTYIGDSVAANNAFTIYNGVSLYGGFAGNEAKDYDLSLRDFSTNTTILDGQNVQRVVYQDIHFSDITYIDGFTVRNGYKSYDRGAGMYLRGKSYVRNCTITNNTTADNYAEGGGIYMNADSDHPSNIENCVINSNTANSYGGGVYMKYTTMTGCSLENNSGYYGGGLYAEYSTVSGVTVSGNSGNYGGGVSLISTSLSNSTITGNTCEYGGGGVYANGSSTITGCEISDNSSTSYSTYDDNVGGVYASYSEIKNCVIRNNSSNNVGGVSLSGGTLDNCLVANNTGTSFAGGVYMSYNSNVINCDVVKNLGCGITANNESWGASNVVNTIVWGNEEDSNQLQMRGSNMVVSYSAITDGWDGTENIALSDGNSDIFGPHFTTPSTTAGVEATPGSWSWQLADGSFCINRGTSEGITVPDKDLAGNTRTQQGAIDMGCYESAYGITAIPSYSGGIVYVTETGAGSQNGTSWDNAMSDINKAVGVASNFPGVSVWVAAGTYTGDGVADHNALNLRNGVSLYGGFAGNEPADYDLTLRDLETNATILDGQNTQRVVYQVAGFTTTTYFDGFTVRNGRYNGIGGYASNMEIAANCHVRNCVITGCYNESYGIKATSATLSHCVIIKNNRGIYLDGSVLDNCLVANNGDKAVYMYNSASIINCNIVNNYGSAIYAYNSGCGSIVNTIIWGNDSGGNTQIEGNNAVITYSAITGGYTGTGNINLSADNFGSDPEANYVAFLNPTPAAGVSYEDGEWSWQLTPTSACIDVGTTTGITPPATDLAGAERIIDAIDMGCFEFGSYVIENTIYAEICQGESYNDNGFNVVTPAVGNSIYTNVGYSYLGFDSIMHLDLTVHPKYFIEEERFVCDSVSIKWHGKTLTESGVYYDSLTSSHSCDSVHQFTVEFHRKPLGEFSLMTPSTLASVGTDTIKNMPLSLLWNSVTNADLYDIYLWDVNNPEPDEPYISGFGNSYVTLSSALQNHHKYNWYVVARNACHEVTSPVHSFYVKVTPQLLVSSSEIDFGEIALNGNTTMTVAVNGSYLLDDIEISLTGTDASTFSFTKASGWNDMSGGLLVLGFHPTTPKYNYEASVIVSSGALADTIKIIGGVANLYTFTTNVEGTVYSMGSTIPITGTVKDWEDNPAADLDVEVSVIVMDVRRTIMAHTNASGEYSTSFKPLATESGYYVVNSGRAGSTSVAIHDSFNIPGMAILNNNEDRTCLVDQGWSVTDSILIRNKSNLPLTGLSVTQVSSIAGCSVSAMPLSLGGLDADYLIYTISGSTLTEGFNYEELKLKVTSAEGAETQFSVWYYCKPARSALDIYPTSITTNMTKGKSKIVDVMLVNGGTAETGKITIELPDVAWMSLVGSDTLSSIAVNDTAYFSLRLSPANNISLVQYSGSIGIHSEREDHKYLDYDITAVSESTGSILFDATDDYTYNTNGGNGPHLADAHVTVIGYYSLETVAEGYTDSDGHFLADNLPEGYYRVRLSKDKHAEYNNTIQVLSGFQTNIDAYMQYQAVTYSWDVVPTEVQDQYTFDLVVVFETNVPVPVITIEHTGAGELEPGETGNFSLIITNHGLITTHDVEISFDDNDEYVFTPLYDYADSLPALTTIIVPCQYTRVASRSNRGSCNTKAYTISNYECSDQKQWTLASSEDVVRTNCGTDFPYHLPIGFGRGKGPTLAFGDPLGIGMGGKRKESTPTTSDESCTPCSKLSKLIVIDVMKCIPLGGSIPELAKAAKCGANAGAGIGEGLANGGGAKAIAGGGITGAICVAGALGATGGGSVPGFGAMMCMHSYLTHLVQWSECHYGTATPRADILIPAMLATSPLNYMANFLVAQSIMTLVHQCSNIITLFKEPAWEEEDNTITFLEELGILVDDSPDGTISSSDAENLASTFVGTSVTHDDIITLINRLNRSISYWDQGIKKVEDVPAGWDNDIWESPEEISENCIGMMNYYNTVVKPYSLTVTHGKGFFSKEGEGETGNPFIDDLDFAFDYTEQLINRDEGNSVCAKVTVKFSQTMTMTREAFEGTLSVHNGNDENSIENIGLNLVVKDKSTGNDCTSLFQINTKSLSNITSIDGSGSLGADQDGTAVITFIPTKNAAPTEPKIYSFGGTFTFTDPYTGDDVEMELYPVDLTVNPSPDLYVDYFMQRDILGDDALTEDKVEPSVPAELGVRIHNKGMGVAKNVNLETAEPEIVDNDKGLAVDFAMYGASYNGNEAQIGLKNIPFGNIASGATGVGEWLFTSSLLGHFVSYQAHVVHNDSYDNPELSLVSSLRIHELIHPIRVYGAKDDGINDFLVNDVLDGDVTPDTIHFSQGGCTGVGVFESISFDNYVTAEDTIVTLTVDPSRIGWNYGNCEDPGQDKYELVSCTRDSDGQEIPLQNVWQTFVTLIDASEPLYENKLHIVDTLAGAENVTYTLVYTLKTNLLDVEEIITGIDDPSVHIEYPLTSFQVKFNEKIIDSTFTYRDMTLKCNNGDNLMNENVTITKVADSLYNVDITGLTNETGYYVLNVNTLNIKDERGYTGYNGKQATWIQYITAITQNDTLVAGWNWWSTYIEQSTISGLDSLEKTLGSNGLQIKSHLAFVDNYYPSLGYNYWYGTLTEIDNESSYRLKLVDDGVTTVKGPRSHADEHEITISPEWNWIGYPLDTKRNVNTATEGFTPEANDIMKSHNESSIYYSGYGWYPVINLEPGNGYMYKSNADVAKTLTYNVSRKEDLATPDARHVWTTNRHAFADNLTVVAAVYLDGERLADGTMELGAFVNGECRGSALLKHFPPLDCYYAVLTVSGEDGDAINFGLVDRIVGGMNFSSEESMVFEKNAVAGDIENPYELRFSTASNAQMTFSMYPNPVEKGRTTTLDIPETETVTEVVITDILGTVIRRDTDGGREVKGLTTRGVYDIQVFTASGNVYHSRLIVK